MLVASGYLFGFTVFVELGGFFKRVVDAAPPTIVFFAILVGAFSVCLRKIGGDTSVVYTDDNSGPLSISTEGGYWRRPKPSIGYLHEKWDPRLAFSSFLQDLRAGLRVLWKSPGFSGCAIILIALVIGGNTTVYSFVHAFITRPAPDVQGDGLVALGVIGSGEFMHPVADYSYYAEQSRTLRGLLGFSPQRFTLALPEGSYALYGAAVTTNYFQTIGLSIAKGRTFTEAENRLEGTGLVAVVSNRLWRERFDSSPDVIGRRMNLNGQPAIVIGVTPPDFQGAMLGASEDVWVPLFAYSYLRARTRQATNLPDDTAQVFIIGRLAQGGSISRAQAEFATLSAQLRVDRPASYKDRTVAVVPYSATFAGGAIGGRRFLPIFSVVTALTLIIVCANVSNLMLGRVVMRQRETVIRRSIGAPRHRILTMILGEGLAISGVAWIAACVFSLWTTRIVRLFFPADPANTLGMRANVGNLDFTPDWSVLGYAMVLAFIGTLAFTIAPAIYAWRQDLLPELKSAEHSVGRGRSRFSNVLVVTQLAFSVLLLAVAGIGYRSMTHFDHVDLRFSSDKLLLVTVNPTLNVPNRELNLQLVEGVRQRLAATPAMSAVSYARFPIGRGPQPQVIRDLQSAKEQSAEVNYIGPGYLNVLGLNPISGRDVSVADRLKTAAIAVVNPNLAEAIWPGRSPIGQFITLPDHPLPFEVVGVAPNAFFNGSERNPRPNFVFLAEQQDASRRTGGAGFLDSGETTLFVRYTGRLESAVASITRTIKEVDDRIPVVYVRTMNEELETMTFGLRVITRVLMLFSIVSLLIATTGQYAVVAFSNRQRIREFGVRVAMGASPHDVLGLVLREGFILTILGLTAGLLMSFGVAATLRSLLDGITATDPLTYAGVFVLLSIASLVACYLPARKASRVDPLVALRYE